jgi:hypothetical protein
MLHYWVDWECPEGHKHVREAEIDVRHPGSPIRRLSIAELLAMTGDGATFYMEIYDDSGGDDLDVTFAPCECGHGWMLTPWVDERERLAGPRQRR